jgi:plastocyanin/uncharacterized membrane protein YozB (DUF420 family)
MSKGFLGTNATFLADLNLLVQILMGIALLYGMRLARKKRFKEHKYCQTAVMILNLVMIFLVMAPSFHKQVQPQIPARLGDAYYGVSAVHAGLGTLAEVLGIYIVLVAATKILPRALRFKRFKRWMRIELALWWIVILLGVGTYYFWYVAPEPATNAQKAAATEPAATAPNKVTVKITNFQFEPKELTVPEGTTVEWVDEIGRHTVEADDGSFKSDVLVKDGKFEHKFEQQGDYPYFCALHGDKGGKEMAGLVRVMPASK